MPLLIVAITLTALVIANRGSDTTSEYSTDPGVLSSTSGCERGSDAPVQVAGTPVAAVAGSDQATIGANFEGPNSATVDSSGLTNVDRDCNIATGPFQPPGEPTTTLNDLTSTANGDRYAVGFNQGG